MTPCACGLSPNRLAASEALDEVEAVPFSCIDLSELPAAEQETALKLLLLSSRQA